MSPARLLLLLVVVALLGGCGSSSGLRVVNFHPAARANQGRPFYLIVRTVTEKDFFTDHYQKIAGMVFPPSEDPSILTTALVWPGRPQTLHVKVPDKKAFAVYVLYTTPGDPWKVLVTPPLTGQYHFVLDEGRIVVRRPAGSP